ncbi:MAG: hypothetical protein GXO41_02330 [Gammaproteobacteria bacterium]|nr:hypothetical protein [Gammaproteobacteria bacterium]NPA77666.1 hypothetical protein [Gammaproteobacteria bacterium]
MPLLVTDSLSKLQSRHHLIGWSASLYKVSMRDTRVFSMTFSWQNHDQTCAFTPVLSY